MKDITVKMILELLFLKTISSQQSLGFSHSFFVFNGISIFVGYLILKPSFKKNSSGII